MNFAMLRNDEKTDVCIMFLILSFVLIVLRLTGAIVLPWWVILSPIYTPLITIFVVYMIVIILRIVFEIFND